MASPQRSQKPTNGKAKASRGAPAPWYVAHAGRFASDPVFEQIVRLGRAHRQSQRPTPTKGKRARPR